MYLHARHGVHRAVLPWNLRWVHFVKKSDECHNPRLDLCLRRYGFFITDEGRFNKPHYCSGHNYKNPKKKKSDATKRTSLALGRVCLFLV